MWIRVTASWECKTLKVFKPSCTPRLRRTVKRSLRQNWKRLIPLLPLVMMSGVVTAIVLVMEAFGALELLELQVFDRAMQSRPPQPPDDRLLVVGITEQDLKTYGWPLSDGMLAQMLQRLQQGGAKVIGIDLYRDLYHPPGTSDLNAQLQQKNVVGIFQLGQETENGVAPPPALVKDQADQIGFNDLILDTDSVVRRGLLFASEGEQTYQSLAFRLARYSLQEQNIRPQILDSPSEGVAWGATTLVPLSSRAGGYARMDDRGYQILLEYRSGDAPAPVVTAQAILHGQVSPDLIYDRIVLIGSLAPSLKDQFFTPYTSADPDSSGIAGVFVHAHFTQQLLDLAAGKRSLFRFLSPSLEGLWLALWTGLGVVMLSHRHHPLWSVAGSGASVLLLWGLQYGLLRLEIWVPVISPTLGLGLGIVTSLGYSRYRLWKVHQDLLRYSQEQTTAIAQLQALNQKTLNQQTLNQQALSQNPTRSQYLPTALPEGESHSLTLGGDLTLGRDLTIADTNSGQTRPDAMRTPALPPGGTLGGRYLIQSVLGEGGFGITYLAQDSQRPGQPSCVIKRLSPARRDPRFLQAAQRLFQSEAQILESLGRHHDRIPQLLAYFEEDQEFFLVQDLIDGHTFSDELSDRVPLSPGVVLDFLVDVLPTLAFIHRHQLIHRDLKPSNLIRRKDGALVVIDFGAVKHFSDVNEAKTLALGTPGYMAPEQSAGHPRLNSDLYALGMIAIQCLVAKAPSELPVDPETADLVWQPLVQEYHRDYARLEDFIRLLSKLVEYNACDRYQSAEEALRAFENFKKSSSLGMVA